MFADARNGIGIKISNNRGMARFTSNVEKKKPCLQPSAACQTG